jgi:hypothetical protein
MVLAIFAVHFALEPLNFSLWGDQYFLPWFIPALKWILVLKYCSSNISDLISKAYYILAISIGTREQNSNKSGGLQEFNSHSFFSYKNL